MVNPIPPNNPAPNKCFHVTDEDKSDHPNFTTSKENRIIPIGFPSVRPNRIPRFKELINVLIENSSMAKAVLASAKMGIINKVTGK